MTSPIDIWRSAKLLVDQHGADARIRAAQRADEPLAAGNIQSRSVWLRILEAIKQKSIDRTERADKARPQR